MIASVVRLALAWIAMLVAQIAVGTIIHLNNPPPPHAFLWLMVSNAFTVLPVGAAALRSDWRGWRLLSALFFITGVDFTQLQIRRDGFARAGSRNPIATPRLARNSCSMSRP